MKILFIFMACLFLINCKPDPKTKGGSSSGSSPTAPLPTVSIATDLVGVTASNAANFTLSGTCSEEGEAVIVSVEDLSPETAPLCTNLAWATEIDLSSLTGASRSIVITANHSISGGSLGAVEATGSVVLHPRVTIATNLGGITTTNLSSFEVRGTCSENEQPVTVSMGGVNASPTCTNLAWSTNINLSSLTGASRSIAITANHAISDGSLNAIESTGSAVLYPRVTIVTNLSGITPTNLSSFEVRGTCSENEQLVTVSMGGVSASPTCTNLVWTTNINLSSLTGASRSIAITANHATSSGSLDAVEATGSAVLHPRVTIVTDLSGITTTNLSSFEVRGTCSENGQPVTISMGGVSATPTCTNLVWTTNINLSSLTGASRSIAITANHATSDGNLTAIEATGNAVLHPRVTIATNLSGITSTNLSSFEVRGTCSENGQLVKVSMGGVSATPTCMNLAWITNINLSSLTGASRSIAITANHSISGGSLDAVEASGSAVLYPRVTIATNLVGITTTNLSNFEVRGTCSENGQLVTVRMGGMSATPTCMSLAWIANINLSALTGASRSIAITANHAISGGSLTAIEATGSAVLHPRVSIATNLVGITTTNLSSFAVRGTCSENGQLVTVRMGGMSATPTCTNLAWITNINLSSLTGASRSIDITANHATSGGSLDAVEATGSAVLHPRVTIVTNLSGITTTNLSSFEVRGTCSENGQPVTISMGGVSATPTCTNLAWTTNINLSSLTGASRSIDITANHATSGGSLDAVEATGSAVLHPRVTIVTNLGGITTTNLSSFEVRGTCSENGQPVTISMGGVSATPTCTNLAWTTNINLSSLTGASRSIAITANHAISGGSLTAIEATGSAVLYPRVSISTNLGNITGDIFTVNGACSESSQPVTVVVGSITPSPAPTCTSGSWSVSVDVSGLASGEINITANHSTSGSNPLNATQASKTVTLYPRVGIAASVGNITGDTLTVSGTCSEDGQPVTVDVGGASPTTAPTCTSTGTWSTSVDVSGLTGASRPIAITADHATSGSNPLNATQASKTVTLYPRVSIAASVGNINGDTFTVNGTCSENSQPVTVVVGGVSPATAPTCTSGTWSTSVDVSSLASGEIDITANHSTSGSSPLNATQANETVTLYPRVEIDTESLADITFLNASSFSVSGTCSEEGQPVEVSVGTVDASSAPTCTTGAWSVNINVSALSGTSIITVITADHSTSGDPALSATQATANVLLNPPVSINTLALENITAANAASFVISGSCLENGESVEVSVGGVSATPAPNCTNGAWTTDIDVTGLNQTSGAISVTADHSPSGGPAHPQAIANVTNEFTCPLNYVGVPALSDYTTHSFCVMKYEAKSTGYPDYNAISQASGRPYTDVNRNESITACTGIGDGYDLITNDEWQSLARNIELVSDNWSAGVVGHVGGLSGVRSGILILDANSDDTEGCHGTGQTCSDTIWNSQRRTHTLSNGEVVWDIAANVEEWVKDTNNFNYGEGAYMSQVTTASHPTLGSLAGGTTTTPRNAKDQFGPSGDYTSLNTSPYGNLGLGGLSFTGDNGVVRGFSGVFDVSLNAFHSEPLSDRGFRCVFHP